MDDEIVRLYNVGLGTLKLARKFKVSRSTVQRLLKREGIVLRRQSPRAFYDVQYFEEQNNDTTYWAGFFAADGNIKRNYRSCNIHLSKVDKTHLDKLAVATKFEGTIEEYEKDCRITFSGEWFIEDLKRHYRMHPAKSVTLEFPNGLLPRFYASFIRGYIDGDGCITVTTCPTLAINGTKQFLGMLSHIFKHQVGVTLKSKNDVPPIQSLGSPNGFQISYSGKNAKKILDWVYKDSTYETRLDRKYQLYQKLFQKKICI